MDLDTLYRSNVLSRGRSGGRAIASLRALNLIRTSRWDEIFPPPGDYVSDASSSSSSSSSAHPHPAKAPLMSLTDPSSDSAPVLLEPRRHGEAVVMPVLALDKCRALRLRALLSSSNGRDVVLLHEKHPEYGLGVLRVRHGGARDKNLRAIGIPILIEYLEPLPVHGMELTDI